ncbi:MAG: hypothetical protein GZ091_16570 [Paludibacter sp.]|nr:hypothetical protein [Paludibacter sp.]
MKTTMIMLFLALVSWSASAQMDHSMKGGMTEMKSKMTDKSNNSESLIST